MLNLLFPNVCCGCKSTLLKSEHVLCTACLHQLPMVCHHKTGNPAMKNLFYGKCRVEAATALVKFQKRGLTQELLHQLKYRGKEKISSFFGAWLGQELAESFDFKDIELVIPVPLHKQKLKKRGFNQVTGFGKEIAKALAIPYREDILIKIYKTTSQVFKQRFKRFQGEEIFSVSHPERIENKHILLVDDIVTTGATLENCALQLNKSKGVKLSFATIAIA